MESAKKFKIFKSGKYLLLTDGNDASNFLIFFFLDLDYILKYSDFFLNLFHQFKNYHRFPGSVASI